jgi:hypothetical protein
VLAALAGLVPLAAPLAAQDKEPSVQDPDRPALDEQAYPDEHDHAFEFAIGGDALWFAYRNGLHRGEGYWMAGLLVNEDDDFAVQTRLMRFAETEGETPLGMGVGLGLFGALIDETDDELVAITLTGAVDYGIERVVGLAYPTRVGLEVSYAPDAATFLDGERVFDVRGLIESDLSSWATAFVGYRHLEVDIDGEDDPELDSAFQLGVRLGF